MKKGQRYLPIILCFLLALWLPFSNAIVAAIINGDMNPQEIPPVGLSGDTRIYWNMNFSTNNSVTNQLTADGWIVSDSMATDDETEAFLVFIGKGHAYRVPLVRSYKEYVMDIYPATQNDKRIMNGVYSSFSTVGMKNDEYRICVQIYENDKPSGYEFTNNYLLLDGNTFEVHGWFSKATNVFFDLETLESSEDILNVGMTVTTQELVRNKYIKGFAYLEGFDTKTQTVLLEATHINGSVVYYDMQILKAHDLIEGEQDDKYLFGIVEAVLTPDKWENVREYRILVINDSAFAFSAPFNE